MAVGAKPRHFKRQTIVAAASDGTPDNHDADQFAGRFGADAELVADRRRMVPVMTLHEGGGIAEGERDGLKAHWSPPAATARSTSSIRMPIQRMTLTAMLLPMAL